MMTYFTTPELISIFRDQIAIDDETFVQNDSELDLKFTEILLQSIHSGASDIHLEIFPDRADIKYRIHGILIKVGELDSRTVNRLVNYVYNVAAAEGSKDTQYNSEEMQDALLDRYLDVDGIRKHFKLRLQTAPCYPNSVTIVMRVLPVDNQLESTLETLGYSERQMELLKRTQMKPSGATIIAGTTGSGKSTTLATMLADIHKRTKGTKKMLTTEDPPEYAIPGANQINLSTKKQQDTPDANLFVKSIKVAMRCDPDIIMVGEVRDKQSADLLSSAVLSGHQVFTTVHAASALGIYDRMMNMGFDRSVITAPNFISLLIYQALVPLVCQHCSTALDKFTQANMDEYDLHCAKRVEQIANAEQYKHLVPENYRSVIRFANHDGCNKCRYGYVGRTVVAEMVEPTPDIIECFRTNDFDKGLRSWRQAGGETVLHHSITKLLAGKIDPRSAEDKCGLLTEELE